MLDNFTSSIKQIQEGRIWTLLTSAFSHYNLPHLLFNMMGLYFLGQSVYYTIGPARFFHLYLVCALLRRFLRINLGRRYCVYNGHPSSAQAQRRRESSIKGTLGERGSPWRLWIRHEYCHAVWCPFPKTASLHLLCAPCSSNVLRVTLSNYGIGYRAGRLVHHG